MKADESVLDFPKDGLCPDVWEKVMSADGAYETWRLIPEVKDRLLSIAQAVCDEAKLDYSQMRVHVTGSITSNTYTSSADIDLHLHLTYKIRELAEVTQKRVKNAFDKVKQSYTADGASVAGHPVEVYYQPNEFQDLMSVGCYDVKSDAWIVGPEVKDAGYNPYSELYQQIQAKANSLLKGIRDKVLDVYEKAVVLAKVASNSNDAELAAKLFNELYSSMASAVSLYQSARQMRKVYSSPESAEQAMKFRRSKKWKIADAAFKLMDKFGYLAILKQYTELYELINSTGSGLVDEVASSVLKTVKKYINNPEKLADNEKLKESILKITGKMRRIVESWKPDFDNKPVNQWGERWQKLDRSDWHVGIVEDAAKDCQIDIYEDGPKLERLDINSVHLLYNGNLIVTVFGGANGGEIVGGCNLTYYLSLLRKFVGKLVDGQYFDDAWFIDWDNDCCDDVWTFRFVLHPTDKTKSDMLECGYEVLQVKESIDSNECLRYVIKFKDCMGYRDDYMPKKTFDQQQNSLAHECALRLPTDTEAREIQGDAVITLVLSGNEEAVKIGKLLGDVLMRNAKSGADGSYEELLILMSDAYKAMSRLEAKQEAAKRAAVQKAKDTLPNAPYVSEEQIDEDAKEMLTTAALVALLAIKNICPAASLETALKDVPKSEMKASSAAFKQAVAKATQGKSCNGMNLTNVINCIARTIYAEAAGEGDEGQAAVASVIWNRAGGKRDKLIDVVLKPKQFSCWNKKTPGKTDKDYVLHVPKSARDTSKGKKAWENCVYLATKLADEEFTSTIGNRNSYMNKSTASQKAKDSWGSKLDLTVGKHSFGYLASNDGFRGQEAPTYIVKKGDTLSAIAKAHNTTVDALQMKNSIKDPNKIKIGQKILV